MHPLNIEFISFNLFVFIFEKSKFLIFSQFKNNFSIFSTFSVLKWDKSKLIKEEHPSNILIIYLRLLLLNVSDISIFCNSVHPLNISFIFMILLIFQSFKSIEVNELQPENILYI